jgi:hypothetical protein
MDPQGEVMYFPNGINSDVFASWRDNDENLVAITLWIHDVTQRSGWSADREHVTGLECGTSAHWHCRIDAWCRVGLLAVDHESGCIALQIGVVVGRAFTATGGE